MAGDEAGESAMASTPGPSFGGRLKLDQFIYTSPENVSNSIRRSPRLSTPLPAIPLKGQSPSKACSKSSVRSSKRKYDSQSTTTTNTTSSQTTMTSIARTPSPKKRSRVSSSYAPPSTYAHLPFLPDVISPNLLILFVGLNPGLQTARSGHAYAHPSNLFWKLLYSSGITTVPCKAEEDGTLPERFSLGNTNIVARPSRNGAELSKAEMDEGVEVLEEKVRQSRPEVVCVVGKSIWESIWRVRKGKKIRKEEFRYGWQNDRENMGVIKEGKGEDGSGSRGAKVFVATSTSGLAATLRPEEKERIWKELGDWCKNRRKEREAEAQV
ncbi:hydrolase-like protein [Xylariales sp. AK1849]|nr:hydrolase-like protein [Xylariales sp. AK1849]